MKRFLTLFLFILLLTAGLAVSVSAAEPWDGVTPSPTVSASFSGGSGSLVDPYRISTPKDLAQLASNVNDGIDYSGVYFRLTADIALNDTDNYAVWKTSAPANKWVPIGKDSNTPFRGYFDGNNRTVSGIYIDKVTAYSGLFGYVSGGTVTNLTVNKSCIKGADYVGGIVGYITDSVYFTESQNHLDYCHFSGYLSGTRYVGGIAGSSNVNMEECSSDGEIVAENRICGGIVGNNTGATISLCSSTATIKGPTALTGGIAGKSTGTVEQCWNLGEINAVSMAGGITGYNGGTVKNCFNAGAVRATDVCVGGIVAENDGDLGTCYNAGVVEGETEVGAIVGRRTSGSVFSCYFYSLCGATDTSGTRSLNETQMKTSAAYNGFNMSSVWVMGGVSGYPYPTLRAGTMMFTCDHNSTVVVETPCTCETDGVLKTVCTVCSKVVKTETVGASHAYELSGRVEPTCTAAGTETYTCTACRDSYKQVYGEPTGHNMNAWITTKVATCSEDGARNRSCKYCDYSESEVLASIEHSYVTSAIAPTCTEGGHTASTCRFCGSFFISDEKEATGHTAGEWEILTPRSFTENEESRLSCTVCNELLDQRSKPAYGFFVLGGSIFLLAIIALLMIITAVVHRKKAAIAAAMEQEAEQIYDSRGHDPFDDTDEFFITHDDDEEDKLSHTTLVRQIDSDPYDDSDDWDD